VIALKFSDQVPANVIGVGVGVVPPDGDVDVVGAWMGARPLDGTMIPTAPTVEASSANIVTPTRPLENSETLLLVDGPTTCRTASCKLGRPTRGRGDPSGRVAEAGYGVAPA
jgi:hypothetical protein